MEYLWYYHFVDNSVQYIEKKKRRCEDFFISKIECRNLTIRKPEQMNYTFDTNLLLQI